MLSKLYHVSISGQEDTPVNAHDVGVVLKEQLSDVL